MLGIPEEEITDEQRSAAKVLNFSFVYGASTFGIARKLEINVNAAERLMTRYFAVHPNVAAFLDASARKALETGEVRTLTGRLRQFGDVSVMSDRERREVVREGMNHPMQGSCADDLKLALALLYERHREYPGAVPIIALHDELVVECNEEDVEAVAAWLEEAMVDGMAEVVALGASGELHVPVEVEVKIGRAWDNRLAWPSPASEYSESEEQAMLDDDYDEAVHIELYTDYRDAAADNYPVIVLCDGCVDAFGSDIEGYSSLMPEEGAECEHCRRRNAPSSNRRRSRQIGF